MADKHVGWELAKVLPAENGSAFSLAAEHQPDDFDVLTLAARRSANAHTGRAVTPRSASRHVGVCECAGKSNLRQFEMGVGVDRGAEERCSFW